jgi:HK97 family phage portal protein
MSRSDGTFGLPPDFWESIGRHRFGSHPTRAGVSVGPIDSLEVAAYAACIGVKAKVMAAIPCNVYKRMGKTDTAFIATDHPTNRVLSLKSNDNSTAFTAQNAAVVNRSVFGDSYAIKDYNGFGQVNKLWPCISSNVEPVYIDNLNLLDEYDDIAEVGDIAYRVTKTWPRHEQRVYPASRVLHIPYPFSFNGFAGINPQRVLRPRLAIAKALVAWEQDFFGKGFSPAYVGELDERVGKNKIAEAIEKARQDFSGFKGDHGLLILDHVVSLKQDSYNLDHAMLDKREEKVVRDICGFTGVPPMLISHAFDTTFNNSLQYFLMFKKLTVFPWAVNDEQAFDCWLLGEAAVRRGYFTKYDPKILDMQDGEAWSKMMLNMFHTSSITPDEIRADLNKNPLPEGSGGNLTYTQSQNIPLADAGETEQEAPPGQGLEVVSEAA